MIRCTFALASILVGASPAFGQEIGPDKVSADRASAAAVGASEVLEAHCADVAAGRATESAEALGAVSPALTEVSSAHDATGEAFLLYWRGRLNLCLDREERAREDLEAFVEQASDDASYAPQLAQARQQLRRLGRVGQAPPKVRTPGAAVAGGAALLGSGALAGLSAWQWTEAEARAEEYLDGQRPYSESEAIADAARSAQTGSAVLVGSAVGAGLGGVVSLLLSTLAPNEDAALAVMASPTPRGGLAVALGGTW